MLPCLLYEDEHLLVVNKPAGLNTHAPSPYAGEGLYDWLRNREPRWANLAIIHRLDKETSGVILFAKSSQANRSLTEQFTQRQVRKKYVFLTDRSVPQKEMVIRSSLARAGDRYVSRRLHPGAEAAETHFRLDPRAADNPLIRSHPGWSQVEAEPMTGRTHQIRVHASAEGFPILGDTLYGGTPGPRVYLHASELSFGHPAGGHAVHFAAPTNFVADTRQELRRALIDPEATNTCRLLHGASDGRPGWFVERLGNFLFSQSDSCLTGLQQAQLEKLLHSVCARGAYHKRLTRHIRQISPSEASAQLVLGEAAPERFVVLENGLQFELSFAEGYSVGLFLDQRDNRRRLLTRHVAADFPLFESNTGRQLEVLNLFAYTGGFAVAAAGHGARTTSLDASKKYLDWGKRNFALNGLDPTRHDFIYGDVFDWLRRLERKKRKFDAILLDPPTFSQSKRSGVFRATKDYGKLVGATLPLLRQGGLLFASTNAADWRAEDFLKSVCDPIRAGNREVRQMHFAPQPLDFPVSRAEPAYLKTVWLRLG